MTSEKTNSNSKTVLVVGATGNIGIAWVYFFRILKTGCTSESYVQPGLVKNIND